MSKKRLLFCGEASYLNTGFAVYGNQVISRIAKSGKYEVAEFANYGASADPRRKSLPWKFYGNLPTHEAENAEYNKDHCNQFGKWRFEEVCLDFKPTHVLAWTDIWMMAHQVSSPFRKYFRYIQMPTVDSEPTRPEWLQWYCENDVTLTYSQWSYDVLKREAGNKINLGGVASPGADLQVFKPVEDKRTHKESIGLNPDWFIVGSVMRNQKRKLFPDLLAAFRTYLDLVKNTNPDLYQRSFLYLHTSYPDMGWELPTLIREFNLCRKVIVSYICKNCQVTFPSFYQDIRTSCPNCNQVAAGLPNVMCGPSREVLAGIFNSFDIYVQWATNEGSGMSQQEAAACGVPVVSVDHTAMSSVVREVSGIPIAPLSLFREVETDAYKAIPNNVELANELIKLGLKSEEERKQMGLLARNGVYQNISYDKAAQVWMDAIDSTNNIPMEAGWYSEPKMLQPNTENIPTHLGPKEFVDWCIINVLRDETKLNSYLSRQLTHYLTSGMCPQNLGGSYLNESSIFSTRPSWTECTGKTIVETLLGMRNHINQWENERIKRNNNPNWPKPIYLQVA